MIESIGVGFKQIKGEQKLTAKSGQLLSDIKIGDILKGSLTKLENGQTVLMQEDGKSIPVKLQDMAIFNELLTLEVMQKDEGQVVLKLLQSGLQAGGSLQDKIMNELDLPKTDGMRQLIETFLAKQMSMQREGLLRNYHISQSFEIPAEVLTNLNEKSSTISLQEVKDFNMMRQDNLGQVATQIADMVSEIQSLELAQSVSKTLDTYLNEKEVCEIATQCGLQKAFIGNETQHSDGLYTMQNIKEKVQTSVDNKSIQMLFKEEAVTLKAVVEAIIKGKVKDVNLSAQIISAVRVNGEDIPREWERLGKLIKAAILKTVAVNVKALEQDSTLAKHIENGQKVLKEILKDLEGMKLPQKYEAALKQVEENVQILSKFNMQGEYYFFPIHLPQGEGKGELYFFKPKKKSPEEKQHLYIVLALDLPKLKNIEVHIRQEKEELFLHFKVKEEEILKLVQDHLQQLKKLMRTTRFNLDEIEVSLIETKKLNDKLVEEIPHLSQMDFKI